MIDDLMSLMNAIEEEKQEQDELGVKLYCIGGKMVTGKQCGLFFVPYEGNEEEFAEQLKYYRDLQAHYTDEELEEIENEIFKVSNEINDAFKTEIDNKNDPQQQHHSK